MTPYFFAWLSAAFILGSVPTAYWTAMKVKGLDIRLHGSGNVGATNVFRVLGRKWGILVFVLDALKGVVPVLAFRVVSGSDAGDGLTLFVGCAAILGHIFTPFLGFKGGKGVATGAGVLLAAFPILFTVSAVVWFIAFRWSRMVSLSSLLALSAVCFLGIVVTSDPWARVLLILLFVLILWSHRSNIARIIKGQESRFIKR